jgi:hypothetical protein
MNGCSALVGNKMMIDTNPCVAVTLFICEILSVTLREHNMGA